VDELLGFSNAHRTRDSLPEDMKVFVVHMKSCFYGFVVTDILDVASISEEIHSEVVDRRGVLGTIHIEGKISTIIDVYEMIDNLMIGSFKKDASVTTSSGTPTVSSPGARNVLIVEDSPLFRKMAIDIVKSAGYNFEVCNDGREALDLLKKRGIESFDIVLSDIEMPRMTGFELVEAIRSEDNLKDIPMIALTTRYDESDIKKGLSLGFNNYLEKFKKEEILNAIENLVA
ncbi:MAG: response regulator, partial [Bdellovibrionales bacterium]